MTRLYISADLEGVCGVTAPQQCDPARDREAYTLAVAQLALEVNTVVDAARQAGATAITVNDSHYGMTNLRQDMLRDGVTLVSGKPKPCAMAAGLTSEFDGAIYLGYHAKAGSERGILNHSFHSAIFDLRVNGVSYGEGGINALYASLVHQVPVILASGDDTFCREITGLLPGLSTVCTKESLSTTAAVCKPVDTVLSEFTHVMGALMQNRDRWPQNRLALKGPYRLEVTLTTSVQADVAMLMPWLSRIDGRTVAWQTDDFEALYRALQSIYGILAYGSYLAY
ncbi:MAG: M55 family metallopeptidase [Candidatus Melainabacteria bacterium]